MINLFKTGTNFDTDLITIVNELNQEFKDKSQVVEFFGSTQNYSATAARPSFRLPDKSDKEVEQYIKKCNDNNIKFNWTCNSISPYISKVNCVINRKDFQNFIKWLENIGVYRVTVANPMLLEFIREVSNIEIELSTILHIDAVSQMKYFHEVYGVNKICNALIKNRDFKFLKNMAKYCNNNDIIFELLANEFCGVCSNDKNGVAFATACPYRDSCYIYHATNQTKEDALLYDNYPMNRCMSARYTSPESWLRMRWIRPQDLHYYNNIGINYFKITGRTGSTEYLKNTIKAYMSQIYNDNLLMLWKNLESIYDDKNEKDYKAPVNIPCNKLDGFLEHWYNNPDFDCSDVECGIDCDWCKKFMEKIK